MPAIYTHIRFGEEVRSVLPTPLRELIQAHPAPFYLGTQGPDILFYHKPLKKKNNPARKKGWELHAEAPQAFFARARKLLTPNDSAWSDEANAPLTAYAVGFLCHFALDSALHPLIDGSAVNGLTHGKIESELDKYQFRKLGKPPRGFNAATLFYPSQDAEYASAAILDVSTKNTRRAMRTMKKINGLFSHKSEFVHKFCHGVLALAGMNKSFGEMFLHKKDDPACKELLPELDGLFERAVELAKEKITEYFQTPSAIEDEFYLKNYSGLKEDER